MVDDLLGIVVIALFYSGGIEPLPLVGALGVAALFGIVVRRRGGAPWWLLVPLAVLTWGLLHASGVHATIAGCLLGFLVPARASEGEPVALAERYEHRWRPVSAGVSVPLFALFAVGVQLDAASLGAAIADPVAQGVVVGLVIGIPLGIMLATMALVLLTRARLDAQLRGRHRFHASAGAGGGRRLI